MDNYPNNSNKAKNGSKPKDVKPVITGKTELKKSNKLMKVLLSDNIADIKSNLVSDVLIPIIIRTVSDIGHNALDVVLGGQGNRRGVRSNVERYSWREPISYENRYRNGDRRYRETEERSYDYSNIMYYSRNDANEVLKGLDDLVCRYGIATVLDLYDLSNRGNETRPSDSKYGWDNLRSARVERVGSKWTISLPKAMEIE